MNSLKFVLVSVSLSLCAAVAHAQDSSTQAAPATNTMVVTQNAPSKSAHCSGFFHHFDTRATRKADECVGPPSFCNIYFGG
jgi:hypothetical protein